MRHRVAGRQLSRRFRARQALFKSLAGALSSRGKIETTRAKAKSLKRKGLRIINLGRRKGDGAPLVKVELIKPEEKKDEG